jgi:hypothetical protein
MGSASATTARHGKLSFIIYFKSRKFGKTTKPDRRVCFPETAGFEEYWKRMQLYYNQDIAIQSEKGRGTEVTLTFPAERREFMLRP